MNPPPTDSNLLTIDLDRLVYGGQALGRLPDGRAVFVPFALPGERVRVRLVEEKRGHARAELVEVLEPSPERIPPRCPHFGACGGCHYQHLPYTAQLRAKERILRDQLERIGRLDAPPLDPIVPSDREWYYRNHVQFHPLEDGRLGFVDSGGRSVLPVGECHLPERTLDELWPTLEIGPGLGLERLALRLGIGEQVMLVLESPEIPELELEAGISVIHLAGGEAIVMAGEESLVMEIGGRDFRVSAGSFFQVNSGVAARMVEALLAYLPVSAETVLLDAYCGVGLFSAFFAPRVGRLIGVEASASACEDFTANLDEFENVELYEAPVEAVLPGLEPFPQVVLLDPPRAGLDPSVLQTLLDGRPERIAYVSCDPATLARDAARLVAGGYRLERVTPFDLFPQTYHIESISLFVRSA